MKQFYAIADEFGSPHEYEIPFFGDKIKHNVLSNQGLGAISIKPISKPAIDADYDMKFRQKMYEIKPIFKVSNYLDYQLSRYDGDDSEFLAQIRYVVLPCVKRGKHAHAEIVEKWLESKEKKEKDVNTYTIQTGDIHAPIQIQQNSNYSSQHQKINYSQGEITELFSVLKKDIEKLDITIREDFNLEMNYAVKQLEKSNDITPQLNNISKLISELGLSFFTNITSSAVFEVIKPFLGLS